jgi:hypothetical protein
VTCLRSRSRAVQWAREFISKKLKRDGTIRPAKDQVSACASQPHEGGCVLTSRACVRACVCARVQEVSWSTNFMCMLWASFASLFPLIGGDYGYTGERSVVLAPRVHACVLC